MTPSRRSVLVGSAAAAVATQLSPAPSAAALTRRAAAVRRNPAFTGALSPNGWPVNVAPTPAAPSGAGR